MATIKKHWRVISFQGLLVLLCVGLLTGSWTLWGGGGSARAQAEEAAPPPVDPIVLQRVADVRQHLALNTGDLAAMGLNQEQARVVLEGLLQWVESHGPRIEAGQAAVRQAQRTVGDAQRKIRIGPRDEQLIRGMPERVAALHAAQEDHKALLDSAAEVVEPRLSAEQRVIWQAARANAGLPDRLRYAPGVDAHQRTAITESLRRRSPEQASRYVRAAEALTAGQRQAVEQAMVSRSDHFADVQQAEQQVLPPEVAPPPEANLEGETAAPGVPPQR